MLDCCVKINGLEMKARSQIEVARLRLASDPCKILSNLTAAVSLGPFYVSGERIEEPSRGKSKSQRHIQQPPR